MSAVYEELFGRTFLAEERENSHLIWFGGDDPAFANAIIQANAKAPTEASLALAMSRSSCLITGLECAPNPFEALDRAAHLLASKVNLGVVFYFDTSAVPISTLLPFENLIRSSKDFLPKTTFRRSESGALWQFNCEELLMLFKRHRGLRIGNYSVKRLCRSQKIFSLKICALPDKHEIHDEFEVGAARWQDECAGIRRDLSTPIEERVGQLVQARLETCEKLKRELRDLRRYAAEKDDALDRLRFLIR